MNAKISAQTDTTQTTTENRLEPARLTPEALDALIERGQNELLSWLRAHAPQAVFTLAGGLDFLGAYAREAAQSGGQVAPGINDYLAIAILDALNSTTAVEMLNTGRSSLPTL